MKHLSKFALTVLLTSAIAIPAYATSSGSSSGASSGGSSASGNANTGGANTSGANVGVGAGAGTGTGSNVGTSARVSGSATTNTARTTAQTGTGVVSKSLGTATDSLDRARAEVKDKVGAEANVRASSTNTVGSTNNNTVGSTSNNTIGSSNRMGASAGTAARSGKETIGQRIDRHRGDTDLFLSSDADASGTLNYDEYVAYTGTTTAQANAQTSFSKLDTDNNGFLSEAEIRARGEGEAGTRMTQ